jgi:DNA-3-methyladenine glycosylase I
MTTQAFPYDEVFRAVERQVLALGSQGLAADAVSQHLNNFKTFSTSSFNDDEVFWKLVLVAFYSGFRAATVTNKLDVIKRHFPDWQTVARYSEADIQRILNDGEMIAHENKVRGCVKNAQTFGALVKQHKSFNMFLVNQLPDDSLEHLLLLKELLQTKFAYLGGITVYHFMTDIGLNVLKPDRVICRLFYRFGLLESEEQIFKAILEGRRFAEATGLPIRYIDIMFVVFGQVASPQLGISKGVCLNEPRCDLCAIKTKCRRLGVVEQA